MSIFSIPGYGIINTGKSRTEWGGLLIYLHVSFAYSIQNITRNSKPWEGLLIEVCGGSLRDNTVVCNIYRPSKHNNNNTTIDNVLNELYKMAKIGANIIIAGDFGDNRKRVGWHHSDVFQSIRASLPRYMYMYIYIYIYIYIYMCVCVCVCVCTGTFRYRCILLSCV